MRLCIITLLFGFNSFLSSSTVVLTESNITGLPVDLTAIKSTGFFRLSLDELNRLFFNPIPLPTQQEKAYSAETIEQDNASIALENSGDFLASPPLLEKAAPNDLPQAILKLGQYDEAGYRNPNLLEGDAKDPEESAYKQAIEEGHPEAYLDLARISLKKGMKTNSITEGNDHYHKAKALYEKALEHHIVWALYHLGILYLNHDQMPNNPFDDPLKAFNYFEKAASLGHVESMHAVAVCYHDGLGVQKNVILANDWYKKAACQHYQPSLQNLVYSYVYGDGVDPNHFMAFAYAYFEGNQSRIITTLKLLQGIDSKFMDMLHQNQIALRMIASNFQEENLLVSLCTGNIIKEINLSYQPDERTFIFGCELENENKFLFQKVQELKKKVMENRINEPLKKENTASFMTNFSAFLRLNYESVIHTFETLKALSYTEEDVEFFFEESEIFRMMKILDLYKAQYDHFGKLRNDLQNNPKFVLKAFQSLHFTMKALLSFCIACQGFACEGEYDMKNTLPIPEVHYCKRFEPQKLEHESSSTISEKDPSDEQLLESMKLETLELDETKRELLKRIGFENVTNIMQLFSLAQMSDNAFDNLTDKFALKEFYLISDVQTKLLFHIKSQRKEIEKEKLDEVKRQVYEKEMKQTKRFYETARITEVKKDQYGHVTRFVVEDVENIWGDS